MRIAREVGELLAALFGHVAPTPLRAQLADALTAAIEARDREVIEACGELVDFARDVAGDDDSNWQDRARNELRDWNDRALASGPKEGT